ncbi:MAG: hypothetical protein CR217_19345 [Beijerinckiaceae bacterium]|nr:MAG: hypothetical protein CR217_19345 [Beijerinckiaceae bacterium]
MTFTTLASFRRPKRMTAFHPLRKFGSEFLCLAVSERHVGLVGLIATWQGGRTADMPALVEEVLGLADVCRTIPQFPT